MVVDERILQLIEDAKRDGTLGNGFKPYSLLSKRADAITVYFKDCADYSERLTDHVTVFKSLEDENAGEIVGCRIKGVSGLIENLPNAIEINDNKTKLRILFWAFSGKEDEEASKVMNDILREVREKDLELEECA